MQAHRVHRAYDAALVAAIALIAAVGVFGACHADLGETEARAEVQAPAPAVAADATGNPLLALNPNPGPDRFDAVVAERVRVGGYAYLRLTLADGAERWLATMGQGQPSGARVTVQSYGVRENFHSRRTGKTFARLLFGEAKPQA